VQSDPAVIAAYLGVGDEDSADAPSRDDEDSADAPSRGDEEKT
jgi:hypothetical protein